MAVVFRQIIVLTACFLVIAACEQPSKQPVVAVQASAKILNIYTVNYPLAYFAQRIGGEVVTVNFPAPADVDPATWRPEPQVILDYQQADLILLNGAGYAAWITRAVLPADRMVDTSALFSNRMIATEQTVRHQHGPDGEAHPHGDTAFTTWLDPELAALHAESILAAFVRSLPEHAAELTANFQSLLAELQSLDTELSTAFNLPDDTVIIFSHPVYQYLAKKYGIQAETMHWEPDQSVTPEDMSQVAGISDRLGLVIWEAEPLAVNINALSVAGYQSVVFNPAANPPGNMDYLEIMMMNVLKLRAITQ